MCSFRAKIIEPLAVPLSQGDILYTPPPPSSGVILVNILNILSGYNFTAESINGTDNTVLTYHRIIEAFKHAYATRTKLGDMDFLNLEEVIFIILYIICFQTSLILLVAWFANKEYIIKYKLIKSYCETMNSVRVRNAHGLKANSFNLMTIPSWLMFNILPIYPL